MPNYSVIKVKEACRILGIGKSKLYELLAEGSLCGYRIGSSWFTTSEACEEYIENQMRIQRLSCESRRHRR